MLLSDARSGPDAAVQLERHEQEAIIAKTHNLGRDSGCAVRGFDAADRANWRAQAFPFQDGSDQ